MSYESAPATKLLATHCAACRRPLVDAKSVEVGLGPDCRKRLGFDKDVAEEARAEANKLVYQVALDRGAGRPSLDAALELRRLGFDVLAARIIEVTAQINVLADGNDLVVTAPYNEAAIAAWRTIPGRRWDADLQANRIPASERVAVYKLLQKHYIGALGVGPKGAFVVDYQP